MEKNVFKKRMYVVANVEYEEQGGITVYPCIGDADSLAAIHRCECSQRGRMTTRQGISTFKPYNEGSGPRSITLLKTPYGEVRETKKCLVVTFCFPKRLGMTSMAKLLAEELKSVRSFLKALE